MATMEDWADRLVFAVEVLPCNGAEDVSPMVSVAVEAGTIGNEDAGFYHALRALWVAGKDAACKAFSGEGAQCFALLVCEGLQGAVCAAGCGALTGLFRDFANEPGPDVKGKGECTYSKDNPCRCLVVVCDVSQSDAGKVLLGCEEEGGRECAKQPFVLWRDDELEQLLYDGEPGGFHAASVSDVC